MQTIVEPSTRTASVREVTVQLLRDLGMTTVFGNPGSTELRFLAEWPADFTYVMGLDEGPVVAMADAYAQVTGNAAFVSVHSAGGLGNAMGTLFTAYRNNAPLVVMAGQQTRAMLPMEPYLFAQDAAQLPRPYVKWSVEPARAEDVPLAIARAYYIAMQRPFGPTFVSVPEDDWDHVVPALEVRRLFPDFVGDERALARVATALNASRAPALVVGAGVDRDGAADLAVRFAERIGARVFAGAMGARCGFPEDHPQFAGALPRIRSGVAAALAGHDVVIVLGAPAFNYHIHAEGPHVPAGATVFQLTDDPNLASFAAVGASIITALRPALERLLPLVRQSEAAPPPRARAAAANAAAPGEPMTIEELLLAIGETLPPDALIAEEAPSTHALLHDVLPMQPGRFFAAASGSLGFGLPAAIGVALGAPGRRVVAIIGDGSAHYGIQGLWTAAEHRLPITFVIVNNGGYGAMKSFVALRGTTRSPSFDVGHCDYVALARGYGIEGVRIERAADLRAALSAAHAADGPRLIDVAVESTAKKLY